MLTQPSVSTETRLRTVYFVRDGETCLPSLMYRETTLSVSRIVPAANLPDIDLSRWLIVYGMQRSPGDLLGIPGGKPDRVLLVLREAVGFIFLVLQKNGLARPPQHCNLDQCVLPQISDSASLPLQLASI